MCSSHFDVRWTLTHHDIDYDALLPGQITNHFPNTGAELGAKVPPPHPHPPNQLPHPHISLREGGGGMGRGQGEGVSIGEGGGGCC